MPARSFERTKDRYEFLEEVTKVSAFQSALYLDGRNADISTHQSGDKGLISKETMVLRRWESITV